MALSKGLICGIQKPSKHKKQPAHNTLSAMDTTGTTTYANAHMRHGQECLTAPASPPGNWAYECPDSQKYRCRPHNALPMGGQCFARGAAIHCYKPCNTLLVRLERYVLQDGAQSKTTGAIPLLKPGTYAPKAPIPSEQRTGPLDMLRSIVPPRHEQLPHPQEDGHCHP